MDQDRTDPSTRRGSEGGSRRPTAFRSMTLCPACGAAPVGIKCKTVCSRCRMLIENCSGD